MNHVVHGGDTPPQYGFHYTIVRSCHASRTFDSGCDCRLLMAIGVTCPFVYRRRKNNTMCSASSGVILLPRIYLGSALFRRPFRAKRSRPVYPRPIAFDHNRQLPMTRDKRHATVCVGLARLTRSARRRYCLLPIAYCLLFILHCRLRRLAFQLFIGGLATNEVARSRFL